MADKKKKDISGVFKSLKGIKHIEVIAGICILAVMLLIAFGGNKTEENNSTSGTTAEYEEVLASELEMVLGAIKGAGKVEVLITYESTSEIVPAYDSEKQYDKTTETDSDGVTRSEETGSENSSPVTVNGKGGSTTLVLTEKMPQIRGVIIVAEGAGNVDVRLDLLRAARTVLCVSADKVDVFEMK